MQFLRCALVVATLVAASSCARAEDWTPPENPNPQSILREARADAGAKKYDVALAKHVWFHENALTLDPGLTGVRLSFALADWKQLGEAYPPAMAKLRSIRDGLEEQAKQGKDLEKGMHDLAAINRTLGEESRTTEAFKSLDAKNPKAAASAFHFVQRALVKDKAYKLYNKYIDPDRDFFVIKHTYEVNQQLAKNPRFGDELAEFGNKSFRSECATLVAILVINERAAEAFEIAKQAEKVLDDADFRKELDSALAGKVPNP